MTLAEWILIIQGCIMIWLENRVCKILDKEFEYDKEKYERQEERKRRKKHALSTKKDGEGVQSTDEKRSTQGTHSQQENNVSCEGSSTTTGTLR